MSLFFNGTVVKHRFATLFLVLGAFTLESIFLPKIAHAQEWEEKIQLLQAETEQLGAQILNQGLSLSGSRPKQCPVAGTSFKDLAEKMSAISASLTEGKCYEKHSELIRKINELAKEDQSRQPFDITPSENGALVENNPQTVINITNTQITSIQNNNSLISGLFTVAKDKDCLELLRKKGQLSVVAEVLTKFGAIGFFVPSTVGMIGSAAIMAAGGALFLIDKLIQPAFTWKIQQDRKDFMALTCAFYNIRTQLHEAGFFDSPNSASSEKEGALEVHRQASSGLITALNQFSREWREFHLKNLNQFLLISQVDPTQKELYFELTQDLNFLTSERARGETPEERLEVVSHFLRKMRSYRQLLSSSAVNHDYGEKTLTSLETLVQLTTPDLLRLTRKTWQLGYISSLEHFFREILNLDLKETRATLNIFNSRNDYSANLSNDEFRSKIEIHIRELRNHLTQLNTDLNRQLTNLQRVKAKIGLSSQDEGADAEYDLYREFSSIKAIMLGKKGWTFVAFLIQDAKQHMKTYKAAFSDWQEVVRSESEKNSSTPSIEHKWACRNAFSLATHWAQANSAVELAYDFLGANNDLWSQYNRKIETVLGFIPIGPSYAGRMVRAVQSAEKAKQYLETPAAELKEEITGLRSTLVSNLGDIILEVKEREKQKQTLDNYRHEKCVGVTEL